MNQAKPDSRVIPFTGEFYQPTEPQPAPPQKSQIITLMLLAMCLLATGAALGATAVYNSPNQVRVRTLQAQSEQLTQIKKQICN